MIQKTGYIKILLLTILTLPILLIIPGCGQNATLPKYMQPELLYLNEQPYSQIYVEVDVIEGAEVPDEWLDVLEDFLTTHCSKPDGIKVIRDEPIPLDKIKDMSIGPASIFCLDGPDQNSDKQSAYLHIFFFNGKNTFQKKEIHSHIISLCPNTIFFPTGKVFQKNTASCTIQHETGHILGLCKEQSHSDGAHCNNNNCLMNSSPGFLDNLGFFFGIKLKKKLCKDCSNDLEKYKTESSDPNLTFDGPFLIRKEDGYSIASLPYCFMLIPEYYENKFNWHDSLDWIKKQSHENKKRYFLKSILISKSKDGSPPDISSYKDTFVKALDDPEPEVKKYAAQMLKTLEHKE
ncbi:MAG: hypothetical protein JXA96_11315 [Sedimentisphaerales bacterium]|nr:hypothetical protein [Sedimentisphaerales bacterium]